MEPVCEICQGTGWVIAASQGREVARRCSCQKNGRDRQRLDQANIPPRFATCRLKGYIPNKNNRSQSKAKEIAEKFVADYPVMAVGLLFQGPTGTGKTRLLCSIGNQLLMEKGVEVYYIDWNDLGRELKSGEDHSSRDFSNIGQLITRLAGVELLLFDELGASRPSPWVDDNIYYLINRRYNENRITLFAANYFDKKVGAEETLAERVGQRIRSRLHEMAQSVEIQGIDFRQKNY